MADANDRAGIDRRRAGRRGVDRRNPERALGGYDCIRAPRDRRRGDRRKGKRTVDGALESLDEPGIRSLVATKRENRLEVRLFAVYRRPGFWSSKARTGHEYLVVRFKVESLDEGRLPSGATTLKLYDFNGTGHSPDSSGRRNESFTEQPFEIPIGRTFTQLSIGNVLFDLTVIKY